MKNYYNEGIEWTRIWREGAAGNGERVLLIGDSIIDGSKSFIGKELAPDTAISVFVTSKGLNNPYFIKELSLLCEQEDYDYKAVYLNSGLHFHNQSAEEYKENYKKLLSEIRQMLPCTPIILGTSTPWTEGNTAAAKEHDTPITLSGEIKFHERNKTVLEYNKKVFEIGSEEQLTVFDAYSLMIEHPELKSPDGVHFKPEGYVILAKSIASALKDAIK